MSHGRFSHHELRKHKKELSKALKRGFRNIDQTDSSGMTYLQVAAEEGFELETLELLNHGAEVDRCQPLEEDFGLDEKKHSPFTLTSGQKTPLYFAIANENPFLITILLMSGANPHKTNELFARAGLDAYCYKLPNFKIDPACVLGMMSWLISHYQADTTPALFIKMTQLIEPLPLDFLTQENAEHKNHGEHKNDVVISVNLQHMSLLPAEKLLSASELGEGLFGMIEFAAQQGRNDIADILMTLTHQTLRSDVDSATYFYWTYHFHTTSRGTKELRWMNGQPYLRSHTDNQDLPVDQDQLNVTLNQLRTSDHKKELPTVLKQLTEGQLVAYQTYAPKSKAAQLSEGAFLIYQSAKYSDISELEEWKTIFRDSTCFTEALEYAFHKRNMVAIHSLAKVMDKALLFQYALNTQNKNLFIHLMFHLSHFPYDLTKPMKEQMMAVFKLLQDSPHHQPAIMNEKEHFSLQPQFEAHGDPLVKQPIVHSVLIRMIRHAGASQGNVDPRTPDEQADQASLFKELQVTAPIFLALYKIHVLHLSKEGVIPEEYLPFLEKTAARCRIPLPRELIRTAPQSRFIQMFGSTTKGTPLACFLKTKDLVNLSAVSTDCIKIAFPLLSSNPYFGTLTSLSGRMHQELSGYSWFSNRFTGTLYPACRVTVFAGVLAGVGYAAYDIAMIHIIQEGIRTIMKITDSGYYSPPKCFDLLDGTRTYCDTDARLKSMQCQELCNQIGSYNTELGLVSTALSLGTIYNVVSICNGQIQQDIRILGDAFGAGLERFDSLPIPEPFIADRDELVKNFHPADSKKFPNGLRTVGEFKQYVTGQLRSLHAMFALSQKQQDLKRTAERKEGSNIEIEADDAENDSNIATPLLPGAGGSARS